MDGWLVFHVAMPQLHVTYELRLHHGEQQTWDCMIFVQNRLKAAFSGDGATSASDLWGRVFEAIGAPGPVTTGD